MNRNNLLLAIGMLIVLVIIYVFMQHQIKSTENLLENVSRRTSPAVPVPKKVVPPQKVTIKEPTVIPHEHIEVDDGLEIPPHVAEDRVGD